MVYVPDGEFLMGFSESDVEALRAVNPNVEFSVEGEKPQHKVFLDAFYIDETEVTNARYRRFVEAGGYEEQKHWSDEGWQWRQKEGWTEPRYWQDLTWNQPEQPVVGVSWYEADAYCRWVGKRLPTEAEWEKAARGDEERTWPWGNTFDGKKVNFCDKNCLEENRDLSVDDGYGGTAPVGSYPAGASPYGASDMAGNVWEWVADWYAPDYYSQSPTRNPQGPDSDSDKVVRGGSWLNGFTDIRVGYRYKFVPTLRQGRDVGFRCAQSP
jgi:formylglycine-generating enzyme required for sulfatase activity